MAIITISRASYSRGEEIAKQVAQEIGGKCISRESLLETSKDFDTPTMKLVNSFDELPSIFERFKFGKHRYISDIQAAFLQNMLEDKTVYHGFAGHYFIKDISHALKVCIFAPMEERIQIVMERDGVSESDAVELLTKVDEQRKEWGRYLYGINIWDGNQYDLTLNLEKISDDAAVAMICHLADSEKMQMTPGSKIQIEGLALASQVRLVLPNLGKGIKISAIKGDVTLKGIASSEEDIKELCDTAHSVSGVKSVINEIEYRPDYMTSWGIQ